MKFAWHAAIALVLGSAMATADDSPGTACVMLNNRILGPRTENRPLPLMKGDPEHGFSPACSVPWSALSPKNDAIPVDGCFRGSLLRLPIESACGAGTGRLWISSRWVVTSDDLAKGTERAAVCQQLETGAWAGTRAFSFECKPRVRELGASQSTENSTSELQRADANGGTTPASAASASPPPPPAAPKKPQ